MQTTFRIGEDGTVTLAPAKERQGSESGFRGSSSGGAVRRREKGFDEVLAGVKRLTAEAGAALIDWGDESSPNEVTVSFGVKLGVGGELVLSRADADFAVSATWRAPAKDD